MESGSSVGQGLRWVSRTKESCRPGCLGQRGAEGFLLSHPFVKFFPTPPYLSSCKTGLFFLVESTFKKKKKSRTHKGSQNRRYCVLGLCPAYQKHAEVS